MRDIKARKKASRSARESGTRGLAFLVLVAFSLGLAMASCSTTRGSGYGASVSQDSSAAAAAKRDDSKKRSSGSSSGGGSTYVAPPSPYPQPSYGPPPPYYHKDPSAAHFFFDLFVAVAEAATSGTLVVDGLPSGCMIFVDGSIVSATGAQIVAGRHSIRIECFGYLPWTGVVDIGIGAVTNIAVNLEPEALRLYDIAVDPEAFDPSAPGSLGRIGVDFSSSGPGTATVEIVGRDGSALWSRQGIAITGSRTSLAIDGSRDLAGGLEPGSYKVHVIAQDYQGGMADAWGELVVSSYRAGTTFSSLASGFSGALYAPDARILPDGRFQMDVGGYAVFDPTAPGAARLPVFGGVRMGFAGGKAELVVSGMEVSYLGYVDPPDWYSAGVSLKSAIASSDTTAVSLLLGANYDSFLDVDAAPSWDGPTRFSGFTGGLAFEMDSTIARVFGSAQIAGSDYYPGWGAYSDVPGFYSWAYLRGGVELLLPDLAGGEGTFAVSAAGRTSPFSTGLSLTLPLSIGAELHWYAPHSPTILSVYGSGEWGSDRNWYFGGGFGVGLLL